MAKHDDLDSLERTALRIGVTLLSADAQIRIEILEKKLGLPTGASSLSLKQRMNRIEEEVHRLFPGEEP